MMQKLDVPNRLVLLYGSVFALGCLDIVTTKTNLANGAYEANVFARWFFSNLGFGNTVLIRYAVFAVLIVLSEFLLWMVEKRQDASTKRRFKMFVLLIWITVFVSGLLTVINNLFVMGKMGLL